MSQASHIIHGANAQQVAQTYAQKYALPLGAKISVTDVDGKQVQYQVERSMRSYSLQDGGQVKIQETPRMPPLTGGGGGGAVPKTLERDHMIDARTPSHAAMLFARESGVPAGTHLYVTDTQGRGTYFETH